MFPISLDDMEVAMLQARMQSWVALTVAVLFLCATSLVNAAEDSYIPATKNGDAVSAEAMLVDGFLVRPAGLVATVVGTAAFVLTLPFTIPTRSVDRAAQKLVVEPGRYTFVRPLGEIESSSKSSR
jgi:hypothetical protein